MCIENRAGTHDISTHRHAYGITNPFDNNILNELCLHHNRCKPNWIRLFILNAPQNGRSQMNRSQVTRDSDQSEQRKKKKQVADRIAYRTVVGYCISRGLRPEEKNNELKKYERNVKESTF